MQKLPEANVATAIVGQINKELLHTSSLHGFDRGVYIGLETIVIIRLERPNKHLSKSSAEWWNEIKRSRTTPVVLPGRMYERMTPSDPPTVGSPGWYWVGRPTALALWLSIRFAIARRFDTTSRFLEPSG
jgi:hypothetical protein